MVVRFGLGLDFRLNPTLALTYDFDVMGPISTPGYELSSLGLKFEN